jgi:DNA-directed RNA polymerase subunit L
MVKVVNITVKELNFAKDKSPQLKQCFDLVPDLLKFLPTKPKYVVRFELKETNADMANALRRCILNEMPTISLHYDEYKDADISDPYILSDFLKKQIDLIPISQDVNYDDFEIEFDAENKTDEIIKVTTGDFVIKKNKKLVDVGDIMSPLIVLCSLRPGEHLKIHNIKTKRGTGREDGGSFSRVANIRYAPLDVTPLDSEKSIGVSSLNSTPTHFELGYSTHRNVKNPFDIVRGACDVLIERFDQMSAGLALISSKEEYYYSDLIQLETHDLIKEIQFKSENWTTVNLISRYCYLLTDGNIKFVTASIIHPEIETGVIKITHPEYLKLIRDAIKKIIEDINAIKKSFK